MQSINFSVLVLSVVGGKGGVGKTTVALAIAKVLSSKFRVGFVDADITGANAHLMLKIVNPFEVIRSKDTLEIIPAVAELDGRPIKFLSVAVFGDTYVKWSEDRISDFCDIIFSKTKWDCDFLVVDTPPGLHAENIKVLEKSDRVVLVTIPAKFAESDYLKTIEYLRDISAKIAGVYVNFSYIKCECGGILRPFKYNFDYRVPVIEEIPFVSSMPELDYNKLINAIENPIVLKKESVYHKVKEGLLSSLLEVIGRV